MRSRIRAGKEGDREDVREMKEIGRAAGTDGAICHTVATYIFRFLKPIFFNL